MARCRRNLLFRRHITPPLIARLESSTRCTGLPCAESPGYCTNFLSGGLLKISVLKANQSGLASAVHDGLESVPIVRISELAFTKTSKAFPHVAWASAGGRCNSMGVTVTGQSVAAEAAPDGRKVRTAIVQRVPSLHNEWRWHPKCREPLPGVFRKLPAWRPNSPAPPTSQETDRTRGSTV